MTSEISQLWKNLFILTGAFIVISVFDFIFPPDLLPDVASENPCGVVMVARALD